MGVEKQVKSIRLDKNVLNKISSYAAEENRSVSNFIETLLKQYIQKRESAEKTEK